MPIFGAAYQVKAQQFYKDLGLVLSPTENSRIQGLLRPFSDFPVLFKADLIFKDFSRKPFKFKYFSSLCEPCNSPTLEQGEIQTYPSFNGCPH